MVLYTALPGDPRALLEQARAIYERIGDAGSAAQCNILLLTFLAPSAVIEDAGRLSAAAEARGDATSIARCVQEHAEALRRMGDLHGAIALHERALALLDAAPASSHRYRGIARGKYRLGECLWYLGEVARAARPAEEVVAVLESSRLVRGVVLIHSQLASMYERATTASLGTYTHCLLILAAAHALCGEEAAAGAALDKLARIAAATPHAATPYTHCYTMLTRGLLALFRGDLAEADAVLHAARGMARTRAPGAVESVEFLLITEASILQALGETQYIGFTGSGQ
ncbi:hypothetical protein AURDEDRAFT_163362 [Auricularia subglabra TFB-10046 SS5]|nr:hypothetical protein AURDEDRAFT_163362 [Auricularia subglabra TFB-10046 SS5]